MQVPAVTRLITVFSLLMLWHPCQALPATGTELLPDDGKYSTERDAFTELEKKLGRASRRQVSALESEVAKLENYPLYPYLVRQQIDQRMDIAHRDTIENFMLTYQNQPFTYGLRGRWLRYLAKHNEKKAFLANYREGMGATITCQYLQYQLETATNPNYWLSKVEPIWLTGDSQPEECDPIFRQWQEAGLMTEEHILRRIEKAATGGNPKLIPYLMRKLPGHRQYLAQLWEKVRVRPSLALKKTAFPLRNKKTEARLLAYSLNRLAWQDADKAIRGYYLWQPQGIFSQQQLTDLHRSIALSLAIDNKPEAKEWLARADVKGAQDDVRRWHIAYLLRHGEWQQVLSLVSPAPETQDDEDNYRYWRARSLEALGMPEEAKPIYEALAKERHFYGFMASARLNQAPDLAHSPTPRDDRALSRIANLPSARRAYEFLQLGRLIDARREWRYLVNHLDAAQIKDAALLANEWGWYDQSIITFTQSGFMDDVEKRFPLAFASEFSSMGQTYNIQPAFAMAIARRESSFMVDAVSPTGARGLMQLMPGTARYVAAKKLSSQALFDANQNVQYGVQYLRYLMDKMDDNPVLVSASYNAGWRRVMEWLPETHAVDTDIWIENIPYRETRHYVKAVMAYRYIYEKQLGAPSVLFQQLANTAIPSASALARGGSQAGGSYAPR